MDKSPLEEAEKEEYTNSKNHNIVLASFTIAAISVILAFQAGELTQNLQWAALDSLFYLSIAMMCFFIASYLFSIRITRWYVYTAESLEYTGIIAVGIGFFRLIQVKVVNDDRITALYVLFIVGILFLVWLDLRFNKRFFFQK